MYLRLEWNEHWVSTGRFDCQQFIIGFQAWFIFSSTNAKFPAFSQIDINYLLICLIHFWVVKSLIFTFTTSNSNSKVTNTRMLCYNIQAYQLCKPKKEAQAEISKSFKFKSMFIFYTLDFKFEQIWNWLPTFFQKELRSTQQWSVILFCKLILV